MSSTVTLPLFLFVAVSLVFGLIFLVRLFRYLSLRSAARPERSVGETHQPVITPAAQPEVTRSGGVFLAILAGLFLLAAGLFFLLRQAGVSISLGGKTNRYPPFEVMAAAGQATWEAQYPYALADLQLGGEAVLKNYQKYQSDRQVQVILDNWYSGDRVLNLYQLDRVRWDNGMWVVVYGGTQEAVRGQELVTASAIGALGDLEGQVRYILADAELGGVIDYYRQYLDQPAVAEAVRRWDSGVRVANLERFERLILDYAGWKVVYRGEGHLVNSQDIQLTSDLQTSADACLSDEGRIAYILADIQLGGVDGYYRQFLDDPLVVEALRRWDAGVRITDVQAFERRVVGDAGWTITYLGSDLRVDCGDLQQSNPVGGAPPPLQNCHRYFPASAGVTWEYLSQFGGNETSFGESILAVTPDGSDWLVEVLSAGADGARPRTVRCSPAGVFDEISGHLLIPAESDLYEGYTWQSGDFVNTLGFEAASVPAGDFSALRICSAVNGEQVCSYYAEGIGLVLSNGPEHLQQLLRFYRP